MSLSNISVSTACSAAAIPYPTLFGAEFLSIEASLVQNYSRFVHSGYYSNHGSVDVTNVSFCNVTMSYTHSGQDDTVFVKVYLPTDTWNGRFQMVGGGGWQAGLYLPSIMGMTAAVGQGYSTISADAGLGSQIYPTDWALLSPGNVNLYLLENLASVSLNDASVIGKAVTASFYGEAPKCPDAFDGIASSAPAINWSEFFMGDTWPSFFMNSLGEYPPSCEISAIQDALLDACDGLDGLVDGIISDPNKCLFDPMSVVGQTFNCSDFGTEREISSVAATIVQATFSGARKTDNSSLWFGPNKGAILSGTTTDPSMIPTTCSTNGTCTTGNFDFASDWLKDFIQKNASFDFSQMTHAEYEQAFHMGVQQYTSIIGTNDPDLSEYKRVVGRFWGIMGCLIPTNGTLHYYDAVTALDSNVHDFYRMFLAPGLRHCFGGDGPYPDETFDSMRKWVEEGIAPDTLNATSVDTATVINRPLCPYPKLQYFNGTGDGTTPKGFYCA